MKKAFLSSFPSLRTSTACRICRGSAGGTKKGCSYVGDLALVNVGRAKEARAVRHRDTPGGVTVEAAEEPVVAGCLGAAERHLRQGSGHICLGAGGGSDNL